MFIAHITLSFFYLLVAWTSSKCQNSQCVDCNDSTMDELKHKFRDFINKHQVCVTNFQEISEKPAYEKCVTENNIYVDWLMHFVVFAECQNTVDGLF